MGHQGPAKQIDRKGASSSELHEDTHYLVQDALRCFSLVQVLNGAIASLVTLAGYVYKHTSLTGEIPSIVVCLLLMLHLNGHARTV